MGSCAAPSAKGDDKFITTDYLQQCHFDDYLLPAEKFAALKREQALPLAINPNSDQYLEERLQLLDEQLATVTRLAKDNELPDAILTESGLKITPLDAAVPDRAQALIDQTSQLLPRIKITELLMDVDDWTGFSRHFTHLKDGAEAKDRTLLLSAILGDAINLGLTKMAESSPGLTYAKLSWLQAWHIRDETYSGSVPAEGENDTLSVSSVSLHDVSDGILADTELACDPAIAASLGPHRNHLRQKSV